MIESINFHPNTPTLAAKNINDLFQIFFEGMKHRVSLSTYRGLKTYTGYFRQFWDKNGERYNWMLTPMSLEDFVNWLDQYETKGGDKLQPNTKANIVKRVRQAFRWAYRQEYLSSDWSKHVPTAHGRPAQHEALELTDVRTLFDYCLIGKNHLQNCALLAVLCGTGVRRNECSHIQVSDVHFTSGNSGYIDIQEGKGGKHRQVAFDSIAGRFLRIHIEQNCAARIWLFEGRIAGNQLSGKSINEMISRFASEAGIANFDGCHQFRRSFATHWIKMLPGEGYATSLAKQMGHTVPSLTLGVYTKLSIEDVRKLMERQKVSLFA